MWSSAELELCQCELAVEVELKCLGEVHERVAGTYMNIGIVLERQGKFQEAPEFHHKALEIFIMSLWNSHASVATTKKNIGIAHCEMGDQIIAKAYFNEAYDIYLSSLGPDHPDTKDQAAFI